MRNLLTIPAICATTAAFAAPLHAQDNPGMGEIEVTAPRITGDARPFGSGQTRIVKKKAKVNASDLDLERSSHMVILEGRVRNAAEDVCEALEEEVPFGQPSVSVCTERAVTDTMARVRETMSSASA
jgi:UrcA family protein